MFLLSSQITTDSFSYYDLYQTWKLAFSEGESQFNLIKEQLPKNIKSYIDNKIKIFQANYKPVCGEDGSVLRIICNLSDITDLQRKISDYKKGYVENIIVKEISEIENKKSVSQNLESSLRLSINELGNHLLDMMI